MEKKSITMWQVQCGTNQKNKFLNDIKCLNKINTGKTFKFKES